MIKLLAETNIIKIGLDIGTSSIKLIKIENNLIKDKIMIVHHGKIKESLYEILKATSIPNITGRCSAFSKIDIINNVVVFLCNQICF